MKKRIWELDAFRGLCILGVLAVHLIYDLVELYRFVRWDYPKAFLFLMDWGGVAFILLSGICVTLGSRSFRRGLTVFLCGMLCTLVTWLMYRFGFASKSILICFGVLHCLGVCMMLWPVFRRWPVWLLAAAGLLLCTVRLSGVHADHLWLMPLGILPENTLYSDYFPLMPFLGFFLLGAVIGKTLYRRQTTLFPGVNARWLPLRFLQWCGRNSLLIYLLHQPLFSGILYLVELAR